METERKESSIMMLPEACSQLLLDKGLGLFQGTCDWNGTTCFVSLNVDEKGGQTAKSAIETLSKLLVCSQTWDNQARTFAASELVEIANDWQQEENEKIQEITEADFARRLIIHEVSVLRNGKFEVYYGDDGMFFGHIIIIHGSIEEGFEGAEIAG